MGTEWNIFEDEAKLHQGDVLSNDYHRTGIAPGGRWKDNVARVDGIVTLGTSYQFNTFAQ